jgi:regulator of protease activity HflC (stomatin/prohibitin superfamily)
MSSVVSGVVVIVIVLLAVYLAASVKVLAEYERGVVFRLGRIDREPRGPGIVFVPAPLHRMIRISLRVEALEVPPLVTT